MSNNSKNEKIKVMGKGSKAKLIASRSLSYLVLFFLTLLALFPFVMLIVNATKNHTAIMLGFSLIPGSSLITNFKNLLQFSNMPVASALFNSIFISTCVAFLSTYFSAMTAYGIHTYTFKLKRTAFMFILFIMMIPAQVSALGFIQLITKMNLLDSFIPLIIPTIAAPATFYYIKQYLESVLPHEVVEAARADGAGEMRIFNTIVLPMIKPAIAVQAIFSFVASWNNYFMPNLIINSEEKKTIPILISMLRGADYMNRDLGKVYMLIALAIIPLLIVYLLLSKFIISGVTLGSVKG